jgi:tRNA modification GTPase
VTLLDTAGIRDSTEPVEQEGVRRARERAAGADLVLWVTDGSAADRMVFPEKNLADASMIWLALNKVDLAEPVKAQVTPLSSSISEYGFIYKISALNGTGIDQLINGLADFAKEYFATVEAGIVTRARHRHLFEQTLAAINRALAEAAKPGEHEELIAEELRSAATSLGRLTGRVDVEDILDVIFRDFCIGK